MFLGLFYSNGLELLLQYTYRSTSDELCSFILGSNYALCSVVPQDYLAEVNNEHVILGNAAILKCGIPSFVADFARVTGWFEEISGANYFYNEKLGTFKMSQCL